MENEKKIKGTSFRVPPDLLKKFKVACAQRDTNQTAVVVEAIREFVEGSGRVTAPISTPTRGHSGPLHEMLAEVLASGDKEAITAIQQNLIMFRRIAAAAPAPVKKKRA